MSQQLNKSRRAYYDWLSKAFSALPRSNDLFFRKLWREGRLRINPSLGAPDLLDELSAQLICATLHHRERLLIVLPDDSPHRAPLLFATGLLMHTLDTMDYSKIVYDQEITYRQRITKWEPYNRKILYFGSTIGIREHIAQVTAGDENLASVFPQVYRTRLGTWRESQQTHETTSLPTVICVYSPVDPVSIVERHCPNWLAIDCGEEDKLRWLPLLLKSACDKDLPVIAWCQNPLSQCVEAFAKAGTLIFKWPQFSRKSPPLSASPSGNGYSLEQVFTPSLTAPVKPILIQSENLRELNIHFRDAHHALAQASHRTVGRLGQDALRVGWRYLRALEALPVPLDLYEAEAQHLWGVKRVAHLRAAFDRFIEAAQPVDASLTAKLEEINTHLDVVWGCLQDEEPPLWTALTEMCVADVPEGDFRMFVFSSAARKQLFSFALLARYNITEEELHDLRVGLMSLADFRNAVARREAGNALAEDNGFSHDLFELSLRPLLVGLPSPLLSARINPVLRHSESEIEVLVYPHQGPALARRVEQWNKALIAETNEDMEVLSCLSNQPPLSSLAPKPPARVTLTAPATVIPEPKAVIQPPETSAPLWQPADPMEEVAWLLDVDDEDSSDDSPLTPGRSIAERSGETTEDGIEEAPWVEEAIAISFDEEWQALFAADDTIQVITTGADGCQLEERYVRALRSGDRVLFIHGLKRQSLYELIILRVHRHPSIELHLALIRRWQDDFARAYRQQWRNKGLSLDDLLKQLQARGSSLTSPLTLRQWLRGQTLCPLDPEDLHRLADVLNMHFVHQYYRRIHHAAGRLAGLHRGLANRLNRWLEQQAAGIVSGELEEIFDEELGLSLQDFRDSLLILTVRAVARKQGPFLRAILGELEKGNGCEQ